jgi:8-oxo-dGTP pyrophosphatase MutT (NUDIX family)
VKTYRAAGGIVTNGDKVLVLHDRRADELRLPKGHVEPGETDEQAAVREVGEETGLGDLAVVADLGEQTVEFDGPRDHVVRDEHFFLMRLTGQNTVERPEKDEARFEVQWLSPAEAVEGMTFEAEREWIRRAQRSARSDF